MNPIKVGIVSKIPGLIKELQIKASAMSNLVNIDIKHCDDYKADDLKSMDIILGDYNLIGPHLYSLENVKFVQGTWAGLDSLLPHIKHEVELKVPIYRFSGKHFGKMMSEYVIGCIYNHEREILKVYDNQLNRKWDQNGNIRYYRTIYDLTIGVLGIGQIGSRVMETLKFMGANTCGFGRRQSINKAEFPFIDEYFSGSKLGEFLSKCDYIVNTLPNTSKTRGLLDTPVLEACKEKSPVFINVGRGGIISDESLVKALECNSLSHAYLDVFNDEPLPEEHRFWTSPRVKITPHVSATSRAQDIVEQFLENLVLFIKNQPIPLKVDFSKEY